AGGAPGHPPRPPDPPHHCGQPVLGVRLQRGCDPRRRGRPAEPHARRRRDGGVERVRGDEQPASAALPLTRAAPRSECASGQPACGAARPGLPDESRPPTGGTLCWSEVVTMEAHELLDLEREAWAALSTSGEAAASFYGAVLADDVLMLLPGGMVIEGRDAAIASMRGAPWDEHRLSDEQVHVLTADSA